LWVATSWMIWNILFLHKKITLTCEKSLGDATEYRKLLKPPPKLKKNHKSQKEQISMRLVQKIRSYQRALSLEPKKLEQLVEGKKGGTCE